MSIYAAWAKPKYTPPPQKVAPCDGYPQNMASATKILESMWGDVAGLKASMRNTSSSVYVGRLGYSPAATGPKRLPDRKFGDNSGTISDLRRANLG